MVTTTSPSWANMDTAQKARAEALLVAREVTTARAQTGAFGAQTKPEAIDVYALATYIITGEDPWAMGAIEAEYGEQVRGLLELFDLDEGSARLDKFTGLNLAIKADHVESKDSYLAQWLRKVHEAIKPRLSDEGLAALRAALTGQPDEVVEVRATTLYADGNQEVDGYPPADVDGIPWADADEQEQASEAAAPRKAKS